MASAYDAIAEWYDNSFLTGSPVHALALPALISLCGDIDGADVCDLCCGQGIVAREFAKRGAHVTGIDISERLLEIARRYEEAESLGVVYKRGDGQFLADVEDAAFDGVVCCLALMDIPDLDAALREVRRILRPGGRFVAAVTHPCFQTPDSRWTGKAGGVVKREVRGYFNEGYWRSDNPHGVRGRVGAYHRTLSTLLNAFVAAGLILEAFAEPQAQDDAARRVPGYSETPAVLIVKASAAIGRIV